MTSKRLLVSVALAVAFFCVGSSSVFAELKQVPETPKAGEKSRTSFVDENDKVNEVRIVFDDGRTRVEYYTAYTGKLFVAHEKIDADWRWRELPAGSSMLKNTTLYCRNNPVFSETHNTDGTIVVSWFNSLAIANVDVVTPEGKITRLHFDNQGMPSGISSKGKRETLPDGSLKLTWFDADGTVDKTERIYRNGQFELGYYDKGTLKEISISPTPAYLYARTYGDWSERKLFKNGVLTSSRTKTEKALEITAFASDGKTVVFKQHWRNVPRSSQTLTPRPANAPSRITEWVLTDVEEHLTGAGKRVLVFDEHGYNVREVKHVDAGGTVTKVSHLRDDGLSRVDGTVDTVDTIQNGVTTQVQHKQSDKETEKIDPKLLLDPHYGYHEPGIMRITR